MIRLKIFLQIFNPSNLLYFSIFISSTISGFSNVEVSPVREIPSISTHNFTRTCFVLNRETNCILSNLAIGPTWSDIYWLISLNRFSLFLISPLSLKLHNHKVFPLMSCGKPTIALSATGCSLMASSIGAVPRL
jgi:hypothetical protein